LRPDACIKIFYGLRFICHVNLISVWIINFNRTVSWRSWVLVAGDEKEKANRSLKSLLTQISESKPTMASSKEVLMQKYITILTVVALYWWVDRGPL